MERKECNAEGKTSACQKPSFISDVLLNFHQKIIDIKCDYLKERRNLVPHKIGPKNVFF
jgi:hypothetical protein